MAISISMEDHLQGSFSLIFVIVAILIGIRLILRYFQYKEKAFLYAGLTWIGMVSPWFNTAFNYLYVLISGNSMGDQFYVFCNTRVDFSIINFDFQGKKETVTWAGLGKYYCI
ncbi:MAG: hypothetical protein ACTSRH_13715 [Promethearchaeota archaeon]